MASGKFSKIETLLETLDKRLTGIEGKSAGIFQAMSPVSLTALGTKLLEDSFIKSYVDSHLAKLEKLVLESCHSKTAYDIQNSAFNLLAAYEFDTNTEEKLKDFVFQQGVEMNILRRVGAIYLRDILLKKYKLELKDADLENKTI